MEPAGSESHGGQALPWDSSLDTTWPALGCWRRPGENGGCCLEPRPGWGCQGLLGLWQLAMFPGAPPPTPPQESVCLSLTLREQKRVLQPREAELVPSPKLDPQNQKSVGL